MNLFSCEPHLAPEPSAILPQPRFVSLLDYFPGSGIEVPVCHLQHPAPPLGVTGNHKGPTLLLGTFFQGNFGVEGSFGWERVFLGGGFHTDESSCGGKRAENTVTHKKRMRSHISAESKTAGAETSAMEGHLLTVSVTVTVMLQKQHAHLNKRVHQQM